jgi:putative phosphoesterase
MKIGIISDIHANPRALRNALADMGSTDVILCAGDSISEYRFCPETVEILRDTGVRCIRGNHEAVLLGGRNPQYLRKCQSEFPADLLEFLANAPLSIEMQADGARILVTHASPLPPYEDYVYAGSPILKQVGALPYEFIFLGHTHMAMIHKTNGVTVVNPGSCSEPRDQDRRGSYAIVDTNTMEVEIRRFARD